MQRRALLAAPPAAALAAASLICIGLLAFGLALERGQGSED